MDFSKSDKIKIFGNGRIIHQSAGGFVFYESPNDHILYVALLQKQNGKFFIPKGHIQKDEKPEQAAIREIKEELSLKSEPKIITKIGVDNYSFTLDKSGTIHHKNVHLYLFSLLKKEIIKPLESEGFVKAEWLEFNEALEKNSF